VLNARYSLPADLSDKSAAFLGSHCEFDLFMVCGKRQEIAFVAVSADDVVSGRGSDVFTVPVLYVALGKAYLKDLVTEAFVMDLRHQAWQCVQL
jgi:hypothetical protein